MKVFLQNNQNAFKAYFSSCKKLCDISIIVVVAIPAIFAILSAILCPVRYDEAYTYINFTRDWFYSCLVFYPNPNNHILHSFLTNMSDMLPFIPTALVLRLPAITASVLTGFAACFFIKRYYSKRVAVFVVGVVSVLQMTIEYSFQARGYSMIVLFFVIALYSAYGVFCYGDRKYWLLFTVSSILGLYTISSFLYPLLTLDLLILIFNIKDIRKLIVYNLIIIIASTILYLPIVLNEGIDALINNPFVKSIDRSEVLTRLPSFFNEVLVSIFSIPGMIIASLVLLAIIYCVINKDKKTLVMWGVVLVAPILFLIGQSVIPFPRTFIYYGFFIVFLFAVSFKKYIDLIPFKGLVAMVLVVQIVSCAWYGKGIMAEKEKKEKLYDFLLKEEHKTYCVGMPAMPDLEYEMLERGYDITTDLLYEVVSADTIHGFDFVILYKFNDMTKDRVPTYITSELNVYTE